MSAHTNDVTRYSPQELNRGRGQAMAYEASHRCCRLYQCMAWHILIEAAFIQVDKSHTLVLAIKQVCGT